MILTTNDKLNSAKKENDSIQLELLTYESELSGTLLKEFLL